MLQFLLPILAYGAKTYMDTVAAQEQARAQQKVIEEQRKLEELRLKREALERELREREIAEEAEKPIPIWPILIIGGLLLLGGKK